MKSHAEKVAELPEQMKTHGVEDEVIEGVAGRCIDVADDLRNVDARG